MNSTPPRARDVVLVLLLFVPLFGSDRRPTGPTTPPWLRYDAGRELLRVNPGTTVEIRGSGSLTFVEGRRAIRLPNGLTPIGDTGDELRPGAVREARVRLRDDSGTVRWTIRPVATAPAGAGTRIRDANRGQASVDSDSEIRFYLTVEVDGRTEFFEPDTTDEHEDLTRVRTMLSRYSGYGLSAVVAFSEGADEPIRVATAGTRDGSPSGIAMDGETLFELGSLTKQLTAAAILKLEATGHLSVQDSLAAWDPALPSAVGGIRLEQVLLHTSGLPENVDVASDDPDAVWSALKAVTPAFEPGTDWKYSNFGYTVLAALVERLSPDGYIAFVEDSLIGPSGIGGIGFPQDHDWSAARMAVGGSGPLGTGRIDERWPVRARGWNDLLGASGAIATMPALHHWFRALWSGRVLSAVATEEMFTERPPEIAYGWFYMRDDEGTVHIAHGGDTEGTQTFVTYSPSTDELVVLGVNDKRGWRGTLLSNIPTILDEDSLPSLPPAVKPGALDPDELTGTYDLPGGAELEVSSAGSHVFVGARGGSALAMLTGVDSALALRMNAFSDSTARFLAALVDGDSTVVEGFLAASGREESFWDVWAHLSGDHRGAPTGFEVVGTIPDRAGRLVSFSTLRFAEGDETLRLVWRPNLDGWGTGGGLPARSFWPVGCERLVSFDPTHTGWVSLRVSSAAGDANTRTLRDDAGRVAVRR